MGKAAARSGAVALGLVMALAGCEFSNTYNATCVGWEEGSTPVSGTVSYRIDIPLGVVPGEQFTVRVDELVGSDGRPTTPAGGVIKVSGAVEGGGELVVSSMPQEFDLVADGEPGDRIEFRVVSGSGTIGDSGGTTCDAWGVPIIASIPINELVTTTSTSTTITQEG
jgi:hypothetical protein